MAWSEAARAAAAETRRRNSHKRPGTPDSRQSLAGALRAAKRPSKVKIEGAMRKVEFQRKMLAYK